MWGSRSGIQNQWSAACVHNRDMVSDQKLIKGTENDSSQPAMRVKRRGEKSLAGLTAEPAFKPKLEIYKFFVMNHFCFHFKFILFPTYLRCMTVSPRPMVRGTRLPLMFMLCSSVTEKHQSHL